jgi:ABC-type branched-subunit amino acid transport system substrate-binding protein
MTPISTPNALLDRVRPWAILAVSLTAACVSRDRIPTLSDRPLTRAEARAAEDAYQNGLSLIEAGSYQAALDEFTRVVEEYPSSENAALALYWQGRSHYQLEDDRGAAAALARYLSLSPTVPSREHATLLLANAYYGQGEFENSLAAALEIEKASRERLSAFLDLSLDLLERLPRQIIEDTSQFESDRNWLAPFYLQSARWAHAAGDSRLARSLARQVEGVAGLPDAMRAEAAALAAGAVTTAPPKLGLIAPIEGRFGNVKEEIQRGVQLAMEEVNRGRTPPYELVSRSTASDPDSTIGVIRALARGDRVQAVLGPLTSEFAIPAGRAAQEEGIALVSPTATDARLLEIGPRVFTVNALDGAIGHIIGLYAAQNLGLNRFAILAPENAYGRIQTDAFVSAVESVGARIVYRGTYPPGSTGFTDRLGEIVRAGADGVFLATNRSNEALRILNQMAFFELRDLLPLGTDAWNDETFAVQGRRFARGYFADTFSRDPAITSWGAFAQRYESRYGEPPDNRIAAWGYDAARLAIEHFVVGGGGTATAIGREYRGASGLFRFTDTGTRRAVIVHRIERGQATAVDW